MVYAKKQKQHCCDRRHKQKNSVLCSCWVCPLLIIFSWLFYHLIINYWLFMCTDPHLSLSDGGWSSIQQNTAALVGFDTHDGCSTKILTNTTHNHRHHTKAEAHQQQQPQHYRHSITTSWYLPPSIHRHPHTPTRYLLFCNRVPGHWLI